MKPQTAHNKKGHATALSFGFESCGPENNSMGWKHAKVACSVCGHRLPWYHHHFQRHHRDQCSKEGSAPTEPVRPEGRYGEEDADTWESACREFFAEGGAA